MYFNDLSNICAAKILQEGANPQLSELLTDSRKAVVKEGAVFFAIVGNHHNGHRYLEQLYALGVRAFVVSEISSLPQDASIALVSNTIQALQAVAAHHRKQFDAIVIGITGSNGKTIVKEWLYHLLQKQFVIHRSPKSYNSQIGVPLSVWGINAQTDIAIIEAGISQKGEMHKLASIIQPKVGIFTNIGSAHAEGFASEAQKIAEKALLFEACEHIIYCKDFRPIDEHLRIHFKKEKLVAWSTKDASCSFYFEPLQEPNVFILHHNRESYKLSLSFRDSASIENSLHAITAALLVGLSIDNLMVQLASLQKVEMRLFLKKGIHQSYLIDDSYNNDPAALKIALDFLDNQQHNNRRLLVLSDMLQTGLNDETLYRSVAELVNSYRLSGVYLIGTQITRFASLFKNMHGSYEDTDVFLSSVAAESIQNSTVLIKGARVFEFERIVRQWQERVHGTVLEINLDALTHNLNFFRARLQPKTQLMVMVKAFAYGTGLSEVANLLQFHRVDYLATAYADEGAALRKSGIRLPIMVMNTTEETFGQLRDNQMEPVMYNRAIISAYADYARIHQITAIIHIEIDSGMNRLGFKEDEMAELIDFLKLNPQLKVQSVFSHMAGADEDELEEFSHQQAATFIRCSQQLTDALGYPFMKHLLNSPGILRFPQYHFDMVRLGIGLYGIDANQQQQSQLIAISQLKTTISQINHVQKGESIGYGRKGIADAPKTIATIAIGYADGFSRAFSNGKGFVSVHGQRAKVIGNVCMDMTMIDITGIDARVGDEVVIFGADPSIQELAAAIDTIPYEILTNVSERVKRIYYTE
jgi:Alr-MurF fusion protein